LKLSEEFSTYTLKFARLFEPRRLGRRQVRVDGDASGTVYSSTSLFGLIADIWSETSGARMSGNRENGGYVDKMLDILRPRTQLPEDGVSLSSSQK
jgi:hypothetical protein